MPLEHLEVATKNLADAHRETHGAARDLAESRRELATAEMAITLTGLDGSNVEARKAFLQAETYDQRQEVLDAEATHQAAQLQVTLMDLEYKFFREMCAMRRAELTSSGA